MGFDASGFTRQQDQHAGWLPLIGIRPLVLACMSLLDGPKTNAWVPNGKT